jgi:hypothetical protein
MENIKILAYSERGIFNSIVFYLSDHTEKITQFLVVLGINDKTYEDASKYTFLLEQSFSDFGTCDLVIIIENQQNKTVIFIEGKVKTIQGSFSLKNEFEKLNNCIEKFDGISSNIFVQLYYKHLLYSIMKNNRTDTSELKINKCFKKYKDNERKIGSNKIVQKAVDKLKGASNTFFVAILPNNENYCDELKTQFLKLNETVFRDEKMPIQNIKFVSWEEIDHIFIDNVVSENFEYNKGQIY